MPYLIKLITVVLLLLLLPSKLQAGQRIVNGDPVSGDAFPWMVSIRLNISSLDYQSSVCGASLISNLPAMILTAAHCVDSFSQDDNGTIYYVVDNYTKYEAEVYFDVGRTFPDKYNASDNYYTVPLSNISTQLYIHPNWDDQLLEGYDIALLIFKNENLTNITVVPNIINQLTPQEDCCANYEVLDLIGYGRNETDGVGAEQLEETKVKFINNSLCIKMFAEGFIEAYNLTTQNDTNSVYNAFQLVDNDILCILGNNTDICKGDSGGPLFREVNGEIELIGVTSFIFFGCNSNHPSGYTSVGHYRDWIDAIIYSVFPTSEPTSNPTLIPTSDPTLNPTNPTSNPTSYPSTDPIPSTTFFVIEESVTESIELSTTMKQTEPDVDISNNFYIFQAILSTLLIMCFL